MGFKDCYEMKVDFMEMSSGLIFRIQDYFDQKEKGLEPKGIMVIDSMGNIEGIIPNDKIQEMIK